MNAWARLVGFGFRLLYHEMAWTYDAVSAFVSFGQWREWTRAALSRLPQPDEGPILELAHGTGNLQLDLRQRGWRALGLDASAQMGAIARRKLGRARHRSLLVRARAGALPFASGAFAGLVCTFPTPFILEAATLVEAHRVLMPEGRFVIVPNAVLVGEDVGTAAVEWLYRITGQRGGDSFDVAGYFAPFGFTAHVEAQRLKRSVVSVVVAVKT